MKKFTKTMLILCAIFISLGLVFSIAAVSMGVRFIDLRDAAQDHVWSLAWDSENHRLVAGGADEGSGSTKHYEESFKDIRSIELELDICDVDILYYDGDDISLTADMKNSRELLYEESGRTLKIWDESKLKNIPISQNKESLLTLKVPRDLVFKEIEMSIDMGEANIQGIKADSVELSCDMGKINMDGSIMKEGSFECSMGSIKVSLEGKKDDFNYDIDCGMGSVSVDGKKNSGLSVSKEIDNGASKDLELDCGMGNIDIEFKGGN